MTDLEASILLAVASCRVQSDIPARVLAAIGETHELTERPKEVVNHHPDSPYTMPTGLETPITDYSPKSLKHMTVRQIQKLPVHLGAGRRYRLEVWMKMCGGCLKGDRCRICQPLYDAMAKETDLEPIRGAGEGG